MIRRPPSPHPAGLMGLLMRAPGNDRDRGHLPPRFRGFRSTIMRGPPQAHCYGVDGAADARRPRAAPEMPRRAAPAITSAVTAVIPEVNPQRGGILSRPSEQDLRHTDLSRTGAGERNPGLGAIAGLS